MEDEFLPQISPAAGDPVGICAGAWYFLHVVRVPYPLLSCYYPCFWPERFFRGLERADDMVATIAAISLRVGGAVRAT